MTQDIVQLDVDGRVTIGTVPVPGRRSTLQWSVDDSLVAAVTADGIITGRAVGSTFVTVADDTAFTDIVVTVYPDTALAPALRRRPSTSP